MKRPAAAVALALLLAACTDSGATTVAADGSEASADGVRVVATTSIMGDIAATVVGDAGSVEVLLPIGADPHAFSPSAQQATAVREADLVVANGLDLEEGLTSALESAEEDGVTVFHATDHVDLIDYVEVEGAHEDEHSEDEHSEDDHSEEGADEHSEEEGDDHAGEEGHGDEDPHVWFDPDRMADVAEALGEELAAIDPDAGFADRAAALADDLEALDEEIEALLADIPEADRVLVTNHEVLGYFADAYDFDVVATIIPGGTTLAEPSAADLEDIIDVVADTGARAILAETTNPSGLAEVVAEEVGADIQVVELYTESLSEPDGEAGTYLDMMRVNATRIAEALSA